jgi:hypothetical protein
MGAGGAKEVKTNGSEEEGREEDRQEEEGRQEEEEVTGGLVKEEAEHGLGCAPLPFSGSANGNRTRVTGLRGRRPNR